MKALPKFSKKVHWFYLENWNRVVFKYIKDALLTKAWSVLRDADDTWLYSFSPPRPSSPIVIEMM